MVYWALGAVWLILLIAAFDSLRRIKVRSGAKFAWAVLILLIPIIGLGLYSLRCFIKSDWTFIRPYFTSVKMAKKIR